MANILANSIEEAKAMHLRAFNGRAMVSTSLTSEDVRLRRRMKTVLKDST